MYTSYYKCLLSGNSCVLVVMLLNIATYHRFLVTNSALIKESDIFMNNAEFDSALQTLYNGICLLFDGSGSRWFDPVSESCVNGKKKCEITIEYLIMERCFHNNLTVMWL